MRLKTISQPSIKQTLKTAVALLHTNNLPSPWLEAEVLLAWVLKKPRAFILAHPEYSLTPQEITAYQTVIKKRVKNYPLAYITGHKEFYGLDFLVTKNVLIPRADSEIIIESAFEIIKKNKKKLAIIDVGTGSGCLLITVLKKSPHNSIITSIGLDISSAALKIAQKNARQHHIQNNLFIKSNLLTAITKRMTLLGNCEHLIILANLPYLTKKEIKRESSIKYEPRLALDGGKNGLALYKKLNQQITTIHNKLPIAITLIAEINPQQRIDLKNIWGNNIEFKNDLNGNIRIAIIKI